jgi:SM-20-related protein
LEPLQQQLSSIDGWQKEEEAVAVKAAASLGKVLSLDRDELRALATNLARQGNQSCEQCLQSPDIAAHAEVVALAFFERQYSRLLTELLQQRTDFWGVKQALPAAQCATPHAARVVTAARVDELVGQGLCVIDGALSDAEVAAARSEMERLHRSGELRSVEFQKANNVRNDLVGWLDTTASELGTATHALAPVVSLLRGVPAEVQRHAGWALAVPPLVQAALYAGMPGAPSYYHKHLDCGDPSLNPRRLTAILYLNPGYDAERDGGCLRAYLPPKEEQQQPSHGHSRDSYSVRDVAPKGGRLLLFNSCEVEHEVLPTTASRMAVTLWAFADAGAGARTRVPGGDAPGGGGGGGEGGGEAVRQHQPSVVRQR